ncbi:hypothetical protein B0J13DRAFT_615227 [Dactylonectria estremocensis]|uniref:F-box domain-containing protein n=1 Tax=Dactylonectria estremocensis TaxID=1079267 RepID=A0A9P9JKX9_9HYPO|nr:hypothetical protein B0J13DRAFT_615227 [Dactylonectria estremocensis]
MASGSSSPAPGSVSTPPPSPLAPDMPVKIKGRHRLLRGIQRISSTPSLSSLRRSRSVGSPYSTRSTLSCVSLAAAGPPSTPGSVQPSTPQTLPLAYPSASSTPIYYTPSGEFPFESIASHLAIRRIEAGTPVSSYSYATAPLPAEVKAKQPQKLPFHFWHVIPDEIQIHIFSFLRPKELVQASRVSKAFYKACFDGQLWTALDASEFYQEIPAESLSRIIVAAGPFIKDLNLRGCVQVEHYKRTEAIVKACKNLMNATFEGCQNFHKNTLHTLLRSNEKLVSLNLTGLSAVTNTSCTIIAESCPQLEVFNISWCGRVDARGVKSVVAGCPRLKDLRVGEVGGFDDIDTARMIFDTNNLERLVLSGCAEFNDETLKVLVQGVEPEIDILTDLPLVPPRKLRHLDLSRCVRLTDTGVKALGHQLPNLEGLQLSSCKLLTDVALEPILATTPRLTHLELEDLENLTNTLLSEHLAKAPCAGTLEHLSLSYCENLGDLGMLPVMQKCVSLRRADLDNTRISDLVLAEAAAMVKKRSKRSINADQRPEFTLQLDVYDCQNVTWTGIREVLFRNTQVRPIAGHPGRVSYPTEVIGLKCFYGFQMTVDEHQKRVLRNDLASAGRLERKWADYMQATEEAGMAGAGYRRRRRRAREAQALHLDEEDGGIGTNGRRRARTLGSCTVM